MAATKNEEFAFKPEQFQQIIEDVLRIAKATGASDAAAEVSEGSGLSVSVRKGEVENVERNRDKSVGVAIYIGQRRGNASTSDFSAKALEGMSGDASKLVSDIHASPEYRAHLIGVMARRAIESI